jgi:hypothetical protein
LCTRTLNKTDSSKVTQRQNCTVTPSVKEHPRQSAAEDSAPRPCSPSPRIPIGAAAPELGMGSEMEARDQQEEEDWACEDDVENQFARLRSQCCDVVNRIGEVKALGRCALVSRRFHDLSRRLRHPRRPAATVRGLPTSPSHGGALPARRHHQAYLGAGPILCGYGCRRWRREKLQSPKHCSRDVYVLLSLQIAYYCWRQCKCTTHGTPTRAPQGAPRIHA